jgi:hypothetical protein
MTMTSFDEIVNSFRHSSGQDKQPLPRVTLGSINKDGTKPTESLHLCLLVLAGD